MNADILCDRIKISKLMSSEISTYLTGRYISIPVFTLSFREYLEFKKESTQSYDKLLEEYIKILVDFQSLRLANTNSSQHIRL